MTKDDWLVENAFLYREFAKAINDNSLRTSKTLVTNGPVASNSLVLHKNAKDLAATQISGLSRL